MLLWLVVPQTYSHVENRTTRAHKAHGTAVQAFDTAHAVMRMGLQWATAHMCHRGLFPKLVKAIVKVVANISGHVLHTVQPEGEVGKTTMMQSICCQTYAEAEPHQCGNTLIHIDDTKK